VLDAADVLEQRVDDEQNDEAEERHDADHCAEAASVAVVVVAASVLVPALVRYASEHDHREQLQRMTTSLNMYRPGQKSDTFRYLFPLVFNALCLQVLADR